MKLSLLGAMAILALPLACSSSPAQPPAADPREPARVIGARCPMPPSPEGARLDPPQVLTEMVLLDAPRDMPPRGASIADVVGDPRVTVLSTPHMLGTIGIPATLSITGPGVAAEDLREITTLARIEADGRVQLTLSIALGDAGPPVRTTLVTGDQQLAIVGQNKGDRSLVVLVVPYVVRAQSDLRRIYECKLAQRDAALSAR
jgi:hypothetical protein